MQPLIEITFLYTIFHLLEYCIITYITIPNQLKNELFGLFYVSFSGKDIIPTYLLKILLYRDQRLWFEFCIHFYDFSIYFLCYFQKYCMNLFGSYATIFLYILRILRLACCLGYCFENIAGILNEYYSLHCNTQCFKNWKIMQ